MRAASRFSMAKWLRPGTRGEGGPCLPPFWLFSSSRMILLPNAIQYLEINVTEPTREVAWEPTRAVWGPTTVMPLIIRHQSGCDLEDWAASSML